MKKLLYPIYAPTPNARSIEMQAARAEKYQGAVNSGHGVVGDDAESSGKFFELAHGRRFPDVEDAEQGKREQPTMPVQRGRAGKRDPLADDFVDHYDARIFQFNCAGGDIGGPDSGDRQRHAEES